MGDLNVQATPIHRRINSKIRPQKKSLIEKYRYESYYNPVRIVSSKKP
jgi:hypothetical protein